jgi:hypothetical protein
MHHPGGKDLFLPVLNAVFGQGAGDCNGPEDCDPTLLRKQAADLENNPTLLEVTVRAIALTHFGSMRSQLA